MCNLINRQLGRWSKDLFLGDAITLITVLESENNARRTKLTSASIFYEPKIKFIGQNCKMMRKQFESHNLPPTDKIHF